ncbi:MAG TPA: hypothetical protein VLH75_07665 [Longimicrobiales bacterium]|nr:hypothetical protein [Longimicrobiales bacterium]
MAMDASPSPSIRPPHPTASALAGALSRSWAFARIETARALRARVTLLGAGVFTLAHAVGRWQDAGSDGLFVLGYIAAWALAFGPGLSADRSLSFDRLLVLDLLSPLEYSVGKTAAMVAWIASLAAFAWTVAVLFSGGDVRFASWYTAMAALVALVLIAAVAAVDLLMGTRLPAAATLLLLMVVFVVLAALGMEGTAAFVRLGLVVTPYSYASLGPLLLRACVGVALTLVLVGMAAAARGWRAPRTKGAA